MENNIKSGNKIRTITLMAFNCKECQEEFLTNAKATVCSLCGADLTEDSYLETIEVIDKKDFQKELENMINQNAEESESISIADYVRSFMEDKNIAIPKDATVFINLEWQYDRNPWQFLDSVKFDFDFENKEEIEIELKEAIDSMYSIDEMADNSCIVF